MRIPLGFAQILIRLAAAPVLFAILVALSACQSTNPGGAAQATPPPTANVPIDVGPIRPQPPRVPRVALLLPLSGPHAAIGSSMLQAAEMAFFDVADQEFVLLPRDTGGTLEGAARAAAEVLDQGAALILGPLFSTSVAAVAPIARERGVNVVSFSTNPAVAGDGVFVMGFLSGDQVDRVVAHSLTTGLFRFAALVPNSPYGQQVAAEYQQAVLSRGGQLTRLEFYDPSLPDNSEVVRRFRGAGGDAPLPFDAVLLPVGGQALITIAPMFPYFDIDPGEVRFLGTGQWDTPGLGREPALVGGWYAAADPEARAQFVGRYQTVFGTTPPRLATLAYDATALAAVLAKRPGGPEFTIEVLTDEDGFTGLDGLFRFNPSGRVERSLAVLEIGPDWAAVINPAPTAFLEQRLPLTE
ncbi:MAG: penicillin-binding protein activator [Alphaproteobacteria bacterium]|nr:penicillin-binding protein activator [Alphaproteobacteria bacterium]